MTSTTKSQILMEFIILYGVALTATVILVAAISQNKNLHETNEFFQVKDIASKVQHEIGLLSNVENGYSRQFEVPDKIDNKDYNISIKNNTLTVRTNTTSFFIAILNITGYVKKESNTITKTNGMIYVN